jgi:hypothetical protein
LDLEELWENDQYDKDSPMIEYHKIYQEGQIIAGKKQDFFAGSCLSDKTGLSNVN